MKTISRLFYILLLVTVCACSSSDKKEDSGNSVSTVLPNEQNNVKVMPLSFTDFKHELISNGTISATNKVDLKFETSEVIENIYVKNGDKVTGGQKIASLDQFKLKNNLLQAKDNLERAKLELQDVLISQGYTLRDSAKVPTEIMKIAKVRSNYDNSLIAHELAAYNLKKSVIYAPFDGIVANLFSKTHNIPSSSEAFCTIIGNNSLETDFMILESELPFITMGDEVTISPFSINDYSIEGRIMEVNPAIDKNGMVRVKASVSGSRNTKLYDGMNVKVRVQRSVDKQLVIPKEALVLRTNKKVVFTLKNGKSMWNYVQTGMENSTGYVVLEGLSEGDSIIYEGNINLAHETPVQLIK